jgi:hypothetical protein
MDVGKKIGPGEGFSVRPGGEMASDEDDVEGHMSAGTAAARETRASNSQAGSGRIDVNDKRQDDQDTEGHLGRIPKASDDDTEGHLGRLPKASDDDTEGHLGRIPKASDDDTEGHLGRLPKASDDDDTEGHRMVSGRIPNPK